MTESTAVPHNREAEEATVGSVLINQELIFDLHFLKSDDFYIIRNQHVWKALQSLSENKQPIDLLTVCEELDKANVLSEVGGSAYITFLINAVPSSLNAETYAHIVEENSARRKMIAVANKIASLAYKSDMSLDEAREVIFREITEVSSSEDEDAANSFKNAMSKVYDRAATNADRQSKGLPIITGIKTGLPDLDSILLGIEDEEYAIIAGRPGQGKTSFLFDVGRHNILVEKKNVAIFSLEMSNEEVARRFISQDAEVDSTKIKTGSMDEIEWRRVNKSVEKYENGGKIFLFDISGITPSQLRAKCLKVKRQHGLDLVLVDYIGLMNSGSKSENRQNEISEISRKLKILVKELKCPIIVASQMSRNVEQRTDKRPVLSDLRDSGALEQDANIVIFLHHETVNNVESSQAIIAKRRDGAVGDVPLVYRKEFTTFRSATNKRFAPNEEQRAYHATHSSVGSED